MQYNLFGWVEQDKPISRVIHPSELTLKMENSTMYIFRLVIEQQVHYVYPWCKDEQSEL